MVDAGRIGRRWSRPIVLVAVVALVLRAAFVFTVMRRHPLGPDAAHYREVARNLAAARAYALQFFGAPQPVAVFPPLWPLVLAPVSWATHGSRELEQVWGAVIGTASVALIGWIGLRLGGVVVGTIAAALAAVDPMLIASDASLMSETLFVLLAVLALIATYRAVTRPTAARWAVVGIALGLATLTRSDGALLALIVVTVGVLIAAISWPRRVVCTVVALAAFAVVLTPWMIRNQRAFGHRVLLSDNGGTLLAGANCNRTYRGPDIGTWDYFCLVNITRKIPRGASETEIAAVNRGRGIDYARAHLGELPRVIAARIARTAGVFRPFSEMRIEAFETRVYWVIVAGWVFDLLLAAFAFAGLRRLAQDRTAAWLASALALFVVLDSALAYGNQRFRLAAEPLVVVAAAIGAANLARRVPIVRDRIGQTPSVG